MLSAILLFAVLAFTVYSQLMMRARALVHSAKLLGAQSKLHYLVLMFTDIGVLSALLAAFLAGICWMLVLGRLELSYAYPFVAFTFVLVPVGSWLLFGEPLPAMQLFGIALIVAGVTISALAR
jgi:multidrug transporter EmrE-like cation transporter